MNKPRVYGAWAGNPAGHIENPSRCIESVCGNERGAMPHQCYRKRGHGEGGLYCKQHDPMTVKAHRDAIMKKYSDKWAARQRGWDLSEKRKEAIDLAKDLLDVMDKDREFRALAKAVREVIDLETTK